jgi:hypothetical protein
MIVRLQALMCGVAVTAVLAAVAPGAALPARDGAAAATEVHVTFTKSRFAVSRTGAPAGVVTFVVENRDARPHRLAVDGPGVKKKTPLLVHGRKATLTVNVRSGAYMLVDSLARSLTARWLIVRPAVDVTATGNGSVVTPITVTTGMNCD